MKSFTPKQKEELLEVINNRLEIIFDDPSSADEFETASSLRTLEDKVLSGSTDFTEAEIKWIVEEAENRDYIPQMKQIIRIVKPPVVEIRIPSKQTTIAMETIWSENGHTQMFKYNDGGRAEAGYKGYTGDCVARAVCIASGLPYQQVYDTLALGNATQKKTKRGSRRTGQKTAAHGINVKRKWFQDYMKSIGFEWVPTMLIGQGCKVHLRSDELPMGRLVISVSKHYTAMIDGVLMDTYDCSRAGDRCVYGYFIKK